MLEQIKQRLGANYIEDTDNIIQDIIADILLLPVMLLIAKKLIINYFHT